MAGSNTYSDDSVSWAMAGTPWIQCSVWWVRCGAEPVLVYRRQPGMSMVWSPVLLRFFIFPRRQPLTTLVRLSFILRDSSRSWWEKNIKFRKSFRHLKAKNMKKKINDSMFITTSSVGHLHTSVIGRWKKTQREWDTSLKVPEQHDDINHI